MRGTVHKSLKGPCGANYNGGGLFEEAYSHEALEKVLHRNFASERMGYCDTPVMITSYDIERRKTVFLKSRHPDHSELLCAEASRATSVAPTYFQPVNLQWAEQSATLIDGGVFINSPAVSAYAGVRKLFHDEPIAMLSPGTSELPDQSAMTGQDLGRRARNYVLSGLHV